MLGQQVDPGRDRVLVRFLERPEPVHELVRRLNVEHRAVWFVAV